MALSMMKTVVSQGGSAPRGTSAAYAAYDPNGTFPLGSALSAAISITSTRPADRLTQLPHRHGVVGAVVVTGNGVEVR